MRQHLRRLVVYLPYLLFFALIALFIRHYIAQQWDNLRDETLIVNPLLLGLGVLGFTVGMAITPVGTSMIVANLGKDYSTLDIWHTFYLSQVTKYLPGSIWALPSRAYFFKRRGLSGAAAIEAVFWEATLMAVAACIVTLLSIPLLEANNGAFILLVPASFLVAFSGVILLPTTPFYERLVSRLPIIERLKYQVPLRHIIPALPPYVFTWLVIGSGFALVVRAFDENITVFQMVQLVGLFAVAWLTGFLAFFAPGGIGVRDTLLILGTQQLVHDPLPVVIAIVARLCWTLAEINGLVIVSLIYLQRKHQQAPEVSRQIENFEEN